jgi:dolichol-phosphate mannosyltransferase
MQKYAIIIPTYNEIQNIEKIILGVKKFLPNAYIYIIDDSTNPDIGKLIKQKKIRVKYIHRKKKGRGSAVIDGMKLAIKNLQIELFIEMDADFSHNPNELKKHIKKFKNKNLDLLIASRYLAQSKIINWTLFRKILSRLSNFLARILLNIKINDFTNGYRFYSRRSVKTIISNCGNIGDGFIILSEIIVILYKKKFKIDEEPTIFINRARGKSSVNFFLILKSLYGLLKLSIIK